MGRVFVLGNAGIDLSLHLPHLARPGETAVALAGARAPGGKGLNQAVVAARAGASVIFCAPLGDDADGREIAARLAAEPFAELALPTLPCPTDHSILMVARDGENCIVSLCVCADALSDDAAAAFGARVGPRDWLLLQGNLAASATLAAARAAAGSVMLNAAPMRWPVAPVVAACRVVVVNREEAADITGAPTPEAAADWLRAAGCATAIVTLGAAGCVWASTEGDGRQPATPVAAVDTTGAGDAFCGVLVARLAAGVALVPAIAAGQRAAALCVTRPGAFAALPTRAELVEEGAHNA